MVDISLDEILRQVYDSTNGCLKITLQAVNDDIILKLGTDAEIALLNRSTTLTANTALTGVIIGTPVTPALAANSLIIANITADGDILILGNDGGHSRVALFFDASAPDTILYNVGGTWSAGATAWTIPALTLGGAVTGNSQNIGGLGTIAGVSLATSAATPLLLTNGQLVNIALTSQTTGATTLTIPDFASVVDEFTFKTKAQTMANKTLTAPAINGTVTTTGLTLPAVTLGSLVTPGGIDTIDLGTTAAELRSIYLGDTGRLYFGLAQEMNLKHLKVVYTIAGGDPANLTVNYLKLNHDLQKGALSLWNTDIPPLCPGTAVEYLVSAYGDILVGDIWAIDTNPMTYFMRQTPLTTTVSTQFFSNRAAVSDTNGGASLVLYSDETGAVDSGYISVVAYGSGTGTRANTIRFLTRSGAGTTSERAYVADAGFIIGANLALQFLDTGGVARPVIRGGATGDPVTFYPLKSGGLLQWNNYANSQNNMVLDDSGNLNVKATIQINSTQVVGAQGLAVADATDAASVILRLNELLARTRAHGLISAA